MGLLRGPRLLRLRCRSPLAFVVPLVIVLGHGDGCGCKEQRQNRCADHADSLHRTLLLLNVVAVCGWRFDAQTLCPRISIINRPSQEIEGIHYSR